MQATNSSTTIHNPILRYLYTSWIHTCGTGWTPSQVYISYVFGVMLALTVILAASFNSWGWTWWQTIVAGLLAWDLFTGMIGYNHPAIKRRRHKETNSVPIWHHNLQHIHPLILIFFNNQILLLGLTLYWFTTLLLYVEWLEVDPNTGQRRLSQTAQKRVVALEIVIAAALIALSMVAVDIPASYQLYGITVYGGLALATAILIRTAADFQQTMAVIAVASMIVIGLLMTPPVGFQWLIPIYFLKLLVGFTAKWAGNQCE